MKKRKSNKLVVTIPAPLAELLREHQRTLRGECTGRVTVVGAIRDALISSQLLRTLFVWNKTRGRYEYAGPNPPKAVEC